MNIMKNVNNAPMKIPNKTPKEKNLCFVISVSFVDS